MESELNGRIQTPQMCLALPPWDFFGSRKTIVALTYLFLCNDNVLMQKIDIIQEDEGTPIGPLSLPLGVGLELGLCSKIEWSYRNICGRVALKVAPRIKVTAGRVDLCHYGSSTMRSHLCSLWFGHIQVSC